MNKKRPLYLCMVVILGVFLTVRYFSATSLGVQVPLDFPNSLLEPLVDVEIEGSRYKMFVDLGSVGYGFHLEDRVLKALKGKQELGVGEFGDLKGNIYECSEFQIPEIKMGGELIANSIVTTRDHLFLRNAHLFSGPNIDAIVEDQISRIDGKVGLPVFRNYNCLFDFPNSVIVLQKKDSDIDRIYSSDKFIRIPFSIEKYGIVLSVQTDVGIQRMILDTGATCSAIDRSLIYPNDKTEEWVYSTNQLMIEGCDYGSWDLVLFDISDKWDANGCLGADFFLEHAIFLDFDNNVAYIQRPEQFAFLTQWKRLKFRAIQLCRTAFRRSKAILAQDGGSTEVKVEITWEFLQGAPLTRTC